MSLWYWTWQRLRIDDFLIGFWFCTLEFAWQRLSAIKVQNRIEYTSSPAGAEHLAFAFCIVFTFNVTLLLYGNFNIPIFNRVTSCWLLGSCVRNLILHLIVRVTFLCQVWGVTNTLNCTFSYPGTLHMV